MSFTQDIKLTRAIGSKRYADAIELLQLEIRQAKSDQQGLSYLYHMVGWCHQRRGGTEHLGLAIKAAEQALKIDAKLFDAHRLLAEIYSELDAHALGMLHVRNAVQYANAPERIPVAVQLLTQGLDRSKKPLMLIRRRLSRSKYCLTPWAGMLGRIPPASTS